MPRKATPKSKRTQQIAKLNDQMRKNPHAYGQALISAGITVRGQVVVQEALAKIAAMKPSEFKKGNDPYGERDFHTFSLDDELAYFKIDYYAKGDLRAPSEDPSDPAKTTRIMTVAFMDEY